MTILILSFEGDPHADAVESALENKGAKFYRYGFNSFPARSTLSVSLSADQDPHFLLKNQGIELALKDVTSVWCRRSGQAVAPENTDKNMGQYIRGEAKYILDAIEYFMPHAFWVSSRRSTAAAENKLVQLKIASEAGFLLPESCIGNDPEAVSQLINSQKQLCIKPVKQPNLHRDATFFEKIKGFLYNRKYRNLLAGLKYNPKLLAEFEYMTIRCMMTALLTDKQAR